MNPKRVRKFLLEEINFVSENLGMFVNNTKADFTRNRKLPFSTIIKTIIGMESKSLTNELIDFFTNVDAIEGGMKPKTLQRILGHSNIGITMNLYVHITEDEKQREIDLVADVLKVV